METFIRKGALFLFLLAACSAVNPVRVNSERTVKEKKELNGDIKRNMIRKDVFIRLVKSSQRWMDVREKTGNNDHPMITRAMRLCGLSGNKGYAWCAACWTEIYEHESLPNPRSARVVEWFEQNAVWEWSFGDIPESFDAKGMMGGLYYPKLGRLGHLVFIVGEDKNNYYTYEGNTNKAGSREGDGFYKKIRSKESIAALADYCLLGLMFEDEYDWYLQKHLK